MDDQYAPTDQEREYHAGHAAEVAASGERYDDCPICWADFTGPLPQDIVVFEYLDALRLSGEVNMFGAGASLQDAFVITAKEASTLLAEWMRTYGERHPR